MSGGPERQARGRSASTGSRWSAVPLPARPDGLRGRAGAVRADTSRCWCQGRPRAAAPVQTHARRCHGGWRADSAAFLEAPWPIHHADHEFFRCGPREGPGKIPASFPAFRFSRARPGTGAPAPGGVVAPSLRVTRLGAGTGVSVEPPPTSPGEGLGGHGPARRGLPGGRVPAIAAVPDRSGPGARRGRSGRCGRLPVAGSHRSVAPPTRSARVASHAVGAGGGPVPAPPAADRPGRRVPAPDGVCRGPKLWRGVNRRTYAAPAGT